MAKGVINLQKDSGGVTKITSTDGIGNTEVVLPESGKIVSVDTAVTDNAIARYDGATGKLQNSNLFVYDTGNTELVNFSSSISEIKFTISSPKITENYAYFSLYSGGGANSKVRIGSSTTYTLSLETGNSEKAIINTNGDFLLTSGTGGIGYGAGAGGTVTQLTSKSTAVTLNKPCGTIITHNESLASNSTVYFIFNNSLLQVGDCILICNSSWGAYEINTNVVTNGYAAIYVKNTGATQGQAIPIRYQIIKGSSL